MTVSDPVISAADPEQTIEALQLILTHLDTEQCRSQTEQMMRETETGKISFAGVFVAQRGDRIVGATWCQLLPGRTAVVWPAQLVQDEPQLTATRLYDAVDEYLREHRACLAQGLVTTDSGQDARWLKSCGYHHIADLLYMVSDRSKFPESNPACHLQYRPFSEGMEDRLVLLIEETYLGTLDCPVLNGVRNPYDVLESYRNTGIYNPNRWFFLEHNSRDVGCLLLVDHPDQRHWEIVYTGLVPASRGRGWGLEAVLYAQWLASQADRDRLVLSVDANNKPAIRTYVLTGFSAWDRRSVMLKIFPDNTFPNP